MSGRPSSSASPGDSKSTHELKPESKTSADAGLKEHSISLLFPLLQSELKPDFSTMEFKHLKPRFLHSVADKKQEAKKPPSWIEALGSDIPVFSSSDLVLKDAIGKGSFGRLYRGVCFGKEVAVKKLKTQKIQKKFGLSEDEARDETFEYEVTRLASLRHPRIVRFYGLYTEKSERMFVMEYCEGGALSSWLYDKTKPLSDGQRWQLVYDIVQGLSYLHQQGVVHRDLKPDNILLDGLRRAKLADLGIARVDPLIGKEAKVVTEALSYRSPVEDLETTGDIYSLGLIVWQLVTREPLPLTSDDKPDIAFMKAHIPSDCSPLFHSLMVGCLEEKPELRPKADDIVQMLEEVAQDFHPQGENLRACQKVEALLEEHQRLREERVPLYVTPFSVDEDLDRYWQRWEASSLKEKKESKGGEVKSPEEKFSEPLLLEQCEQSFLKDAKSAAWVLFGDGGLGKTYSVHQLASRLLEEHVKTLEQKSPSSTTWLPLLIRPSLSSWSHAQLKEGLQTCLHYYGLDAKEESVKKMRLLFILDGYDELQVDKDPQNLPQELGLSQFPHAKLIVTCRRYTVPSSEEVTRFGLEGHYTRSYLLPLRLDILLERLGSQLKWKSQEQEHYQTRLQEASSLRAALRNPFVLTLFIKSWPLLSQEDFRQLTRLGIYEGFIYHWLTSQSVLLKEVESILEPLFDEAGTLFGSFCAFSEGLAFYLYQMSSLSLPSSKIEHSMGHSPLSVWVHLKELIKKASLQQWEEKSKELSHSSDSGLILRQEDYTYLMQAKAERFQGLSPLKHRSVGWEFIHKSFLEYFVARFMIERCDNEPLDKLVSFLSHHAIQKESGMLGFLVELFKEERALQDKRQEQLMGLVEGSKKEARFSQAAANAITLLNRANISFIGLDLTGIRIPGADLSFALLDNTSLQEADLTDVVLEGAWLRQTDFRGSQMQGVQFREWAYLEFSDSVWACCYSMDGRWLAVGGGSNIYLYDAKMHQLQRTLKGHSSFVMSVSFDSQGARLASGSADRTVRIWEVSSGRCERVLEGHSNLVMSVSFGSQGARLASGSNDKTVRIWEVSSGRCERILEGHMKEVNSIAFDAQSIRLVSGSADGTIRVWEISSGRCERVLNGHSDGVRSVSFDNQGARLASGSNDKTVRVWEISNGRCERVLEGHDSSVLSVSFDSQGARLASGSWDNTVRVWEISSGRCERVLEGHSVVNSVSFDSQGARLASGSNDKTVRVWEISSGRCERVLEGHDNSVLSVSFDSQGTRLASGSEDGTVRVWEVLSGCCERILEGHGNKVPSVSFDSQGARLASGSWDNTVRIWEVSRGRCERVLEWYKNAVNSISFDTQGTRLASGGWDNTVRIWEVSSGHCEHVLEGHRWWINSVSFDRQGARLASGSWDSTVRVWEVSSARCEHVLEGHSGGVRSVAFDVQGHRLASGSDDRTVRVWEVSSGRCEHVLKGHSDRVNSVSFDSQRARLASGSDDKTVRLWSVNSGACLLIIQGFTGGVQSIAWQPLSDNPMLATGSIDKAVRCWQIQEKEKDNLNAVLYWSSHQAVLVAPEARLDNVKGLSQENLKLLQQRGAHVSLREKKKSSPDKGDEKSGMSPETQDSFSLEPSHAPAKVSTTFSVGDSKSVKAEETSDEKKGEAKVKKPNSKVNTDGFVSSEGGAALLSRFNAPHISSPASPLSQQDLKEINSPRDPDKQKPEAEPTLDKGMDL